MLVDRLTQRVQRRKRRQAGGAERKKWRELMQQGSGMRGQGW